MDVEALKQLGIDLAPLLVYVPIILMIVEAVKKVFNVTGWGTRLIALAITAGVILINHFGFANLPVWAQLAVQVVLIWLVIDGGFQVVRKAAESYVGRRTYQPPPGK